jgi:hypothetical protein
MVSRASADIVPPGVMSEPHFKVHIVQSAESGMSVAPARGVDRSVCTAGALENSRHFLQQQPRNASTAYVVPRLYGGTQRALLGGNYVDAVVVCTPIAIEAAMVLIQLLRPTDCAAGAVAGRDQRSVRNVTE